jgi:hypothetical protein
VLERGMPTAEFGEEGYGVITKHPDPRQFPRPHEKRQQ